MGGTQAVPETRGDADEDEDAPLPPMRDEDEGSDDDDETDARGSDPREVPAKRARRASARIASTLDRGGGEPPSSARRASVPMMSSASKPSTSKTGMSRPRTRRGFTSK